jgi:hypothetical protein
MFRLRYARSAFVEAVFFFRGDSERKDDAGAGNEGAPLENASATLCCVSASASSGRPFRRVAITTSFFGEDLSLVDRRVGEAEAILRVTGFNRCEVVLRLRSTRRRLAEGSASSWPASESSTAIAQRAMSGPCLHGGRVCRRSNTASLYVRLEEYGAIAISGGSGGGRFASVRCSCDDDVVNDCSSAVTAAVAGSASDFDVPKPITGPCIPRRPSHFHDTWAHVYYVAVGGWYLVRAFPQPVPRLPLTTCDGKAAQLAALMAH